MADPYRKKREQMVERQLKARGIREGRILEAFLRVPRHQFVPPELCRQAYEDSPLPIGHGQTISQPYMVAIMTRLAEIGSQDRVLEIGTGSGYQTAILAELGQQIFTVERIPEVAEQAEATLRRLQYTNVRLRMANGTLGWEEEAPFDAILVTAGAPQIPDPLPRQLSTGGRLVLPLEEGQSQVLYRVTRTEEGFRKERGERCTFVPLIGKHGWGEDPRVN